MGTRRASGEGGLSPELSLLALRQLVDARLDVLVLPCGKRPDVVHEARHEALLGVTALLSACAPSVTGPASLRAARYSASDETA